MEIDYKATMRDLSFHLMVTNSTIFLVKHAQKQKITPTGALLAKIEEQFGSFVFKIEFAGAAKAVEGSGWAALVADGDDLHVIQIQNQNFMTIVETRPLLLLDVWEHAYYLDYFNDRGKYVDAFWSLINWDDVASRLA